MFRSLFLLAFLPALIIPTAGQTTAAPDAFGANTYFELKNVDYSMFVIGLADSQGLGEGSLFATWYQGLSDFGDPTREQFAFSRNLDGSYSLQNQETDGNSAKYCMQFIDGYQCNPYSCTSQGSIRSSSDCSSDASQWFFDPVQGTSYYHVRNKQSGNCIIPQGYGNSLVFGFQSCSVNSLTNFQVLPYLATSVNLTSSASTGVYGTSVTFTASVTAQKGNVPTEQVVFRDLSDNSIVGTDYSVGGVASITTSSLSGGSHEIQASYNVTQGTLSSSVSNSLVYIVTGVQIQFNASDSVQFTRVWECRRRNGQVTFFWDYDITSIRNVAQSAHSVVITYGSTAAYVRSNPGSYPIVHLQSGVTLSQPYANPYDSWTQVGGPYWLLDSLWSTCGDLDVINPSTFGFLYWGCGGPTNLHIGRNRYYEDLCTWQFQDSYSDQHIEIYIDHGFTCATPALPDHAHIVSGCTSADGYNSSCVLACDEGYTAVEGSQTSNCDSSAVGGSYTFSLVCSNSCANSRLPTGSQIASGCTGTDAVGSTCTLECAPGYSQTGGSATRICPAPGRYSFDLECWPNTARYEYIGCYKDQHPDRDVVGSYLFSDEMTVETCASFCSNYSIFALEYGKECRCGWSYGTHGTATQFGLQCNVPCWGNNNQTCGGWFTNSIYANFPAYQRPPAGACGIRGLPSGAEVNDGCLAGDSWCNLRCKDGFQQVAGLASYQCNGLAYEFTLVCQDIDECLSGPCGNGYCENSLGAYQCFCYASNQAFDGYTCTTIDQIIPVNQGQNCYRDAWPPSRDLSDATLKNFGKMTTLEICAAHCNGYPYFGVEYGQECRCGFSYGSLGPASVACNEPCMGNETEVCGAPATNSIYLNTIGVHCYLPSPPPGAQVSYGCGYDYYGWTCALQCSSGYTQIGGDVAQVCLTGGAYTPTLECADIDECLLDQTRCGTGSCVNTNGSYYCTCDELTHHWNGVTCGPMPIALDLGCYWDQYIWGYPAFPFFAGYASDMTVEKCAGLCGDWPYFGLQGGGNCFCGSSYGSQGSSPGYCWYSCYGNYQENCGGYYASAVYRNGIYLQRQAIVCQAPQLPPNSHIVSGCSLDHYGQTCNLQCDSGYYQTGGNATYYCSESGNYTITLTCAAFRASYVACVNDIFPQREFSESTLIETAQMTLETCATHCLGGGFVYFALQYGYECRCGNSYGAYGSGNPCTSMCLGNPSQTCGGLFANSVYYNPDAMVCSDYSSPLGGYPGNCTWVVSPNTCQQQCAPGYELTYGNLTRTCQANGQLTPTTAICSQVYPNHEYVGCYQDSSDHDLPSEFLCLPSMTIDICAANCKHYAYFALSNGGECRCGNNYGRYGNSSNCNAPCTGNAPGQTEPICGGFFTSSVYRNTDLVICSDYMNFPVNGHSGDCGYVQNGLTCHWGCQNGYRVIGDPARACLHDGRLTPSNATCELMTCSTPTLPAYTKVLSGCSQADYYYVYPWYGACSLDCIEGYQYIAGSQWTPCYGAPYTLTLTCEDIDECSFPGICGSGNCTNLPGSFDCVCLDPNEKFNGTHCNSVQCSDLSYPVNGQSGNCSLVTAPESCVQTCNEGYTLVAGSLERACQMDGLLTPQTAYCAQHLYNLTYVGCYRDSNPNRDLPHDFECNKEMTINMCAAHCANYQYFAVANGDECRCGNSYGSFGEANNCDTACLGNANETCGGLFANSIYQNNGPLPVDVSTFVPVSTTASPTTTAAPFTCFFRHTSNCVGNGPREPWADRSCMSLISTYDSGYCECSGKPRHWFDCGHPEFRCAIYCDAEYSKDLVEFTLQESPPNDFYWSPVPRTFVSKSHTLHPGYDHFLNYSIWAYQYPAPGTSIFTLATTNFTYYGFEFQWIFQGEYTQANTGGGWQDFEYFYAYPVSYSGTTHFVVGAQYYARYIFVDSVAPAYYPQFDFYAYLTPSAVPTQPPTTPPTQPPTTTAAPETTTTGAFPPFDLSGQWWSGGNEVLITQTGTDINIELVGTGRPNGYGRWSSMNLISIVFPDDRLYTATVTNNSLIVWDYGGTWARDTAPSTAPTSTLAPP